MAVRHRDRILVDAGQVGDVDALLDCPVGAHFGEKVLVGVDSRWDLHAGLVILWYFPDVFRNLFYRNVCARFAPGVQSLGAHSEVETQDDGLAISIVGWVSGTSKVRFRTTLSEDEAKDLG